MATTVNRVAVHRALTIAARAVATRSPVAATAYAHLSVTDDGRLAIQTTDLDLRITTLVEVGGPLKPLCVPHKLLADWIGAVPAAEIALEPKRTDLALTAGTHAATIKGIDPELFPPPPTWGDHTYGWVVEAAELHASLSAVLHAAAKDDTRPMLHGVSFTADADGNLVVFAADGFRLAISPCRGTRPLDGGSLNAVVPIHATTAMVNALADVRGDITVRLCKTHISLTAGDTTITSRQYENVLPNHTALVPREVATVVTVNAKDLMSAAKSARIVARDALGIVRLAVANNVLTLTSTAEEIGNVTAEVDCTVTGPDASIGMNIAYLIDALNALPGQTVTISINRPETPCMLTSPDSTDIHVVMPMYVAR